METKACPFCKAGVSVKQFPRHFYDHKQMGGDVDGKDQEATAG